MQLEEDSNATVKEETDFHFRRRAKTEVKPKSSPASSAAAEFQGFKLRKTGAAKETKEAKSQPGTKAPEFLGFQLRKTGSTAQKTQGVVESKSQPTAKSSKLQESRRREANSSIQKAGEMKEKESQPTPKASGFQSFQGKTSESSARKSRETEHTATKSPEFQGFQLRKTDASTARSRAQTWGVSSKVGLFLNQCNCSSNIHLCKQYVHSHVFILSNEYVLYQKPLPVDECLCIHVHPL